MTAKAYELVVGLEVHCQLGTRSKLFCPVCTGQPGVLPVLNKRAVELAFQAALALDCGIQETSIFARKNYFYPDLPKAYQISQYEEPFSRDGGLDIALKAGLRKRVRIHRIHLEEDAGKLLHDIGAEELDYSLVDFNRSGIPLIEIVSEADLRSAEEAHAYLSALKEVLQYAGISRCDMEKGEMRCDANVSVMPAGSGKFGTRCEIKNVNSFKNVKDAIDYEFRRQVEVVESGGRVVQETRLWNVRAMRTQSMRSKEEAHDYRYFPDPDLVPLKADPAWIAALKLALPELPAARRLRLQTTLGLSEGDSGVLTSDRHLSAFFDAAMRGRPAELAKPLANLIMTELLGRLNAEGLPVEKSRISPERMASLAALTAAQVISSKAAKETFARSWETGEDPKVLVERLGLSKVSDPEQLRAWVREALTLNPQAARDVKGGKEAAGGRIVGAVMKLSGGKADPTILRELIQEEAAKAGPLP